MRALRPDRFIGLYAPASQKPPWTWEQEACWLMTYRFQEMVGLVRSVAQLGVREPVDVYGETGMMADGHHRVVAALLTDRPIPYRVLDG